MEADLTEARPQSRRGRSCREPQSQCRFTGNAVERCLDSGLKELIVTDTVPLASEKRRSLGSRIRQVSVAPLFARAIRSVYEETSISRLFE